MRIAALIAAALLALAPLAQAQARPPLSSVQQIDDTLMVVALANEIRKRCDGIDARMVRALGTIRQLYDMARELGYSEDEISAYVDSKAEQARMRRKAAAWMATQGFDAADPAQFCAFGRHAIATDNPVGRYLR